MALLRFLLRRRRAATELARLLVALDSLAEEHRSRRPERRSSVSLGAG